MRKTCLLTLTITFVLPAATVAQNPSNAAARLVVMPADGLKWADLDPNVPGSRLSICGVITRPVRSAHSSGSRPVLPLRCTLIVTT